MSFSTRSYSQSIGHKTMSVYGGAGGRGTRVSSSRMSVGPFLSLGSTEGLDLHVDANEKATLQNLNDRLASYLEKVHKLEKENLQLEKQIREWYESKTVTTHDYSNYFVTIKELQDKIYAASRLNAKTILDIDNAKLAAEDFKMKYETELNMRLAVEGDIAGLKRVLDEMNMARMDLELQYESLKDELIMLKKNHEEELGLLRNQIGGQVNVTVDARSSVDLNQVMSEIRDHYEALTAKNRKDVELWYQNKMSVVEVEVKESSDTLMTQQTEIKDLKSTLQRLEIELQSQLSMKTSLDGTLSETQARFAAQLANLQIQVTNIEVQLTQINASITSLAQEYSVLLDLKTRLENEIKEYRRLLDGEDESSKHVITKVITVKETVVDGKVVKSSKNVDVNVGQVQ
ncbi:keratin, type I cytoskeletal 13 [Austrofundulus limnaeus]|uniref:Keratin, type I cytoskeletal 13 n=1 Tax=Austrofundulus limnaeus TaxID=52670 RepID=A0A2I4BD21_AUSLI|nr:PREDICTED: keratin, type I cytoskeletal 13-like [Austrofundulus limnaeus]